jgi:hypothetical protein
MVLSCTCTGIELQDGLAGEPAGLHASTQPAKLTADLAAEPCIERASVVTRTNQPPSFRGPITSHTPPGAARRSAACPRLLNTVPSARPKVANKRDSGAFDAPVRISLRCITSRGRAFRSQSCRYASPLVRGTQRARHPPPTTASVRGVLARLAPRALNHSPPPWAALSLSAAGGEFLNIRPSEVSTPHPPRPSPLRARPVRAYPKGKAQSCGIVGSLRCWPEW